MFNFYPDIPTIKRFTDVSDFLDYCQDHPEARDSVSPGGAANRLGVSRQRVYSLIRSGRLRAWLIFSKGAGPSRDTSLFNRASYIYVSSTDVDSYKNAPRSKGGFPTHRRNRVAS